MKAKNTRTNSKKDAEKAVAILKSFCENASVFHEKRYLEGYLSSNSNESDELRVKKTLDGLANVFGCKYFSSMVYCENPGSEDRSLGIEGCTVYEHEFLPKDITDYQIYISVRQSHRII